MSDNGYMIWFLVTAAMTIAVLTIGTLAAADLVGRDKTSTQRATGAHGGGAPGHERTPADKTTTAVAGERQLESAPRDADRDVHGARAYSNAGRQR